MRKLTDLKEGSSRARFAKVVILVVFGLSVLIGGLALIDAPQSQSEINAEIESKESEAWKQEYAHAMQSLKQYDEKEAQAQAIEEIGQSNRDLQRRLQEIQNAHEKRVRELEIAKQLRDIELEKMNVEAAAEIAELEAEEK